ncbi:hypothetical protein SK128_012104 [Halocaridina rubra]|uniref:Uncharacterized protein n=1 Tax=Halocaridina rubra TaxID=373956 RepID=A0AAN9AFN4_HALRR
MVSNKVTDDACFTYSLNNFYVSMISILIFHCPVLHFMRNGFSLWTGNMELARHGLLQLILSGLSN